MADGAFTDGSLFRRIIAARPAERRFLGRKFLLRGDEGVGQPDDPARVALALFARRPELFGAGEKEVRRGGLGLEPRAERIDQAAAAQAAGVLRLGLAAGVGGLVGAANGRDADGVCLPLAQRLAGRGDDGLELIRRTRTDVARHVFLRTLRHFQARAETREALVHLRHGRGAGGEKALHRRVRSKARRLERHRRVVAADARVVLAQAAAQLARGRAALHLAQENVFHA